jgi:NAD-specific glutamate dehydrogenase
MGDELAALRRQLAERILESARDATPEAAVDSYLVDRTAGVAQLTRFAQALAADGVDDVATVLVAMKHIRNLLR